MGDTLPVGPFLIRNSPIDLLFSSAVAGSSLVDARSNIHAFFYMSLRLILCLLALCVCRWMTLVLRHRQRQLLSSYMLTTLLPPSLWSFFHCVIFPIFLLSLSSSLLCRAYHLDTTGTFPWITVYSSIHMNALFHLVSHYDSMHV